MTRRFNGTPDQHLFRAQRGMATSRQSLEEARQALWRGHPEGGLLHFAIAMLAYGETESDLDWAGGTAPASPRSVGPSTVTRTENWDRNEQVASLKMAFDHLGAELASFAATLLPAAFAATAAPTGGATLDWAEGWTLADIERAVLDWAIKHYGGVTSAAKKLGVPRTTLSGRLERVEAKLAGRQSPEAGRPRPERAEAEVQPEPGEESPAKNVGGSRHWEHWDGRPWRSADGYAADGAIWYGPAGVEGDTATEVTWTCRRSRCEFTITEYQHVVGLVDNPPAPFIATSATVLTDEIDQALFALGLPGLSVDREDPAEWARWAAGLGVAKLAHSGGHEEWVNELPEMG